VQTEHRSVELRDAELKGMNFRGYAAVFDTPWNERLIEATGYIEKIKPGAFRKALQNTDSVPFLWQHDRNQLLARTPKSMTVREDGKGLLVEASLPKSGLGEYVRELIEREDVKGMSYGIEVSQNDSSIEKRDGKVYRILTGAQRLLDVTLTWEPAYSATQVELRASGFVATPLQELLIGEEPQVEQAVAESPPNDEAWWGEEPPEPPVKDPRPWWESYIDQIEGR